MNTINKFIEFADGLVKENISLYEQDKAMLQMFPYPDSAYTMLKSYLVADSPISMQERMIIRYGLENESQDVKDRILKWMKLFEIRSKK